MVWASWGVVLSEFFDIEIQFFLFGGRGGGYFCIFL